MTNFDELIQRIGNDTTPIEMIVTPARLFILIAQLQLALRHPRNTGTGSSIARQMVENMAEVVCNLHPDARELIDRGWDDTADMGRGQFEIVREEDDRFDEMRVMNASRLLQQYAKQLGKPVLLAANAEFSYEDGIQPGNPATADLEPIEGLTLAIACNPSEAQFLINGINTLLAAMSDIFD